MSIFCIVGILSVHVVAKYYMQTLFILALPLYGEQNNMFIFVIERV